MEGMDISDHMAHRNRLIALYDHYGSLLTEKQKDIFDRYYQEDLSLTEIAEQTETSRQAVHHTLQRTEQLLDMYEMQLGNHTKGKRREALLDMLIERISLSLKEDDWPKDAYEKLLRLCQKEKGGL